jgi:hypothetical protein
LTGFIANGMEDSLKNFFDFKAVNIEIHQEQIDIAIVEVLRNPLALLSR